MDMTVLLPFTGEISTVLLPFTGEISNDATLFLLPYQINRPSTSRRIYFSKFLCSSSPDNGKISAWPRCRGLRFLVFCGVLEIIARSEYCYGQDHRCTKKIIKMA
jgi:hypothetical protein